MRRALITGLTLVAALAAGCGDDGKGDTKGDGGGDPTTSSSDPGSDSGEPEALPKFCDLLTADQVTEAVGAPVTLTTGPFDACEFDQDDPRALSGSLGVVEVGTDNGGFESYRSGSKGSLDNGVDHPVTGVGEEAFVTTGSFAGGESIQAAGGALVDGGRVYTVNLAQASGMTADELVAISEKLLKLMTDAG